MPQINRIRVNNVKYNFGTQFYDDFMMRFNCNNTIYDLANGGGKSLLMLLLLQNVIPNCTLDEKQPIEKLFRAGCNNTSIHSLIEWKLDSCYQKDNFKYMTTGFCARKGRGNEEDGAGIQDQELAEGEQESGISRESASVEYFNYCIFYREFGDNDIRNLPLVSNGERITYNGLKSYLRNLEKNDFSVSVKIFDRKGDYQNFISQYGLFESQWEIVRGINKTEGHVRTYFETNYKTSRKVIEDLLIEEIIQKSYNNALSVENDEGRMAETLLDIKDKLVELSKKHAQMNYYDSQMSALNNFVDYVSTFEALYENKQKLENTLYDLLCACKMTVLKEEKKLENLNSLKEKMESELINENRCIQTAEVISEQNSLKSIEELIQAAEFNRNSRNKQIEEQKKKLSLMESANDFKDYKQYLKSYDEVTETINNSMRDHEDLLEELKCIAQIYRDKNRTRAASIQDHYDLAAENVAALETKLNQALAAQRESDKTAASCQSLADHTQQQIDQSEKKLSGLMENAQLLVAENVTTEKNTLQSSLTQLKSDYENYKQKQESTQSAFNECGQHLSETSILIHVLQRDQERLEQAGQANQQEDNRAEELRKIYNVAQNASIEDAILSTYRTLDTKQRDIDTQIEDLSTFIENAKNGTYIAKSPLRDKLKTYLVSQYGEDVVEGHEWYRNLNNGQKRDVAKRAPFIEYSFVIRNDFERIKQDRLLDNFERGAYAVPIVSEQILYDMKLEVNTDLVTFGMKNMSFLRDDARLEAEIRLAKEELDTLGIAKEKLADKLAIVWEDYHFIISYQTTSKMAADGPTLEEIKEQIDAKTQERAKLSEQSEQLEHDEKEMQQKLEELRIEVENGQKQLELLSTIETMNLELSAQYEQLQQYKKEALDAALKVDQVDHEITGCRQELEVAQRDVSAAARELEEQKKQWKTQYQPYYDSAYTPEEKMRTLFEEMESEQLEARFFGLRGVLEKETSNLEDKEALRRHYQTSMEKCRNAIAYRDVAFEEIEKLVNAGIVRYYEAQELIDAKKNLVQMEQNLRKTLDELDAQNALMNRLEGSIAHGVHQIEEKYGAYEPFECENPDSFIKQHKQMIEKLKENLKEMDQKLSDARQKSKEIFVIEKDMERIVKNAGLEVPEYVQETDQIRTDLTLSDYEGVHKEYESLIKLAYKKRDEFEKYKTKLILTLNDLNAQELSNEVRLSVKLPETAEQTRQLVSNLKETNTFIQLEKDRITKGIEDMERIKDNFENRCIQTCSNIKTELDRLPNLSTITLDEERISMIGLHIPYVDEKMYKDRMSSYIDETILVAESLESAQERLRYIRNRLTWKRLFSVIVSDMNAVRINLYKRERIKDQSRYLKYEEAVGSTGQSQGIYIQFLIAIINYISSINASVRESDLLGKTIFIDNPFGAAKDIYIWEPIFKLLKTNHVQLIVPARGATPAITGRFDVNYILGQKLVAKRQQTVVVDYYSRTKDTQLEYVKMDYEQVSFDFLSGE